MAFAAARVRKARKLAGLPEYVTFDACRHGGMTELGDAELAEQGVMALSGHRTPQAARLYVKRTEHQGQPSVGPGSNRTKAGQKWKWTADPKVEMEQMRTRKCLESVERAKGIEPSTLSLGS